MHAVPRFLLALMAMCLVNVAGAAKFATIVQYVELGNTTFTMSGWPGEGGIITKPFQHCTVTGGAFTIQGGTEPFSDSNITTIADYLVDNITVSNGWVVIENYLPAGSTLRLSRFSGIVAANKPLIDTSRLSWRSVSFVLKNSDVEWGGKETTPNTQVLLSIPTTVGSTSAIFILNDTASQASAVVSVSRSMNSISISQQSLIAVDYTNCTGCSNGLVYAGNAPLIVQSSSLLRVSHSGVTGVTAVAALINVGGSASVSVTDNSLLVVENVSAAANSVFNGNAVTTLNHSEVVLRYVTASHLGAALDAGATYKLLNLLESPGSALTSAVSVGITECASACMPDATVDDTCSCVCPTAGQTTRYMSFCTFVSDAALAQYPAACPIGCAACSSASTCTVCKEGYTLTNGVCRQPPQPCPSNCVQCASNGVCQECAVGYALSSSKTCEACKASHCATCTTSLSSCSTCQKGYTMIGSTCLQSCLVPNCATCMPADNSKCTSCVSGYTVSQDGVCIQGRDDSATGLAATAPSLLTVALIVVPLALRLA